MASVVQICNMALSHIGSEALVVAIDPPDGSAEAGYCRTFFGLARTELLEPGNWNFSLKRATIAQVANESDVWAYAYTLPSDCLRPLRILRPGTAATTFTVDDVSVQLDDRESAPYDIEGSVLFTNEDEAVLVYVRDVTDTGRYTASFTSALSYLLASYLSGPIIKGNEGAKLGDAMRSRAMSIADVSATAAANSSSTDDSIVPTLKNVRA